MALKLNAAPGACVWSLKVLIQTHDVRRALECEDTARGSSRLPIYVWGGKGRLTPTVSLGWRRPIHDATAFY